MINFFKQIFTWWNRQTVGTFIYTLLKGKFVGKDEFGNYILNKLKASKVNSKFVQILKNEGIKNFISLKILNL